MESLVEGKGSPAPRCFRNLWQLQQEGTEAAQTDPVLRRTRTRLLLRVQTSPFQMKVKFVFDLDTKVLEVQSEAPTVSSIWVSKSSAGSGPPGFLKSKANAAV